MHLCSSVSLGSVKDSVHTPLPAHFPRRLLPRTQREFYKSLLARHYPVLSGGRNLPKDERPANATTALKVQLDGSGVVHREVCALE